MIGDFDGGIPGAHPLIASRVGRGAALGSRPFPFAVFTCHVSLWAGVGRFRAG